MTEPITPDPNQPPNPTPGATGQPAPGAYPPPGQTGGYQPSGQQGGYPPAGQQGGYPPPGQQGGYAQAGVTESDERTWAMLAHFGGIVIGFVAGLVVYLIYKDRSQYLKEQGAEALNFQITLAIAYVVATVLSFVAIGVILFPVIWILQLVFCIIAGLAAQKHENYRYPFAIRLVK